MPLAPIPTVPHALAGEVLGLDGTRCWLDLPQPRDRLTLWAVRGDMLPAHLDLAGVLALQALLGEAAEAMRGE